MTGPSDRATFLVEYLDLPAATGDPEATWETFQLQHLNNSSLFGIAAKSRQVGWSWLAAAESVADGVIHPRTTSTFVSITQDEAGEKIRYARQIIEALDHEVRPRLTTENRLALEFANGSRLISHPCRPLRGKGGNVYLDEFAHYPKDREIYTAALPVTTKGGRLRIGSSTLGASGLFWEIATQTVRPYPGYRRSHIPWWVVRGLCRDVTTARQVAPGLLTEERVRAFGTKRLIEIFENLPLEDFQQEYECAWVDEAVAWITWDEIKRNQTLAAAEALWYRQINVNGGTPGSVAAALGTIEEVAAAVRDGDVEVSLAGGFDVGRTRNTSEIIFVGKAEKQFPFRLGISLDLVEFDDQEAIARKCLELLPVSYVLIDRNGIGMQLAENLQKAFPARAEGVNFTNETKELWSVEFKLRLQQAQVPLPLLRDLTYQIHSIKKKRTAAKNAVFDTEGNEKHHADKYWALALAVWAARGSRYAPSAYAGLAR